MSNKAPHVEEITVQSDLEEFIAEAHRAERYAIDTEFHRERTYYPDLALVQMQFRLPGAPPRAALIDPKAVDVRCLGSLFASDVQALLHAPLQDFDVFEHDVGRLPSRFFDTQLAAGFLGLSSPSLASLAQQFLGVSLTKGDRLSDWTRRPLSPAQKRYAYTDVEHLEPLADALTAALAKLGRLEWVQSEFNDMVQGRRPPLEPVDAWRSISEGRSLQGEQRGALVELAAWRERRARELNLPPRRVYGDIVLVCIAQRLPRTAEDLDEVRGFRRGRRTDVAPLLEAVAKGRLRPPPPSPVKNRSADPRAVALVSAYVGDLAQRNRIDKALLATREDLEHMLVGLPSRLASSWRAELLSDVPARLASGSLALALDPRGGFQLVDLA
jgi:ribonuclease D